MEFLRRLGILPRREQVEKIGINTTVTFDFWRHSQKSSGRVLQDANTQISSSGISSGGVERAQNLGRREYIGTYLNKVYGTKVHRTFETAEAILEGAGTDDDNLRILEDKDGKGTSKAFFALPAMGGSKEFLKQYGDIMDKEVATLMAAKHPGRTFDDLTPDEQETIAEAAEEPAMEWYLMQGDEKFDAETPSPREQAALVAYKLNRLLHLPDRMAAGKTIRLLSVGHKTSTEAFLKYVIERDVHGRKQVGFNALSDIGGSLKILDGWQLRIHNDAKGAKQLSIVIKRENGDMQTYSFNADVIKTLAHEYMTAHNIQAKKADE